MKITCDREKLLSAFQLASAAAPARSPKPILSCVKLDVTGDEAVMQATDLELGIRVQVAGVTADAAGSVILDTQRFGSILRELSDGQLVIESSDKRGTRVVGERSEFKLTTMDPEDFPAVAGFDETAYHELPTRALREAIRRTVFATDNDSSRYALGGVLFEFAKDSIIAVGTDGRRLAAVELPAKQVKTPKPGENTIVPSRALQFIDKVLADDESDGVVQVVGRANDLLIRTATATVRTRLVEGRYPKWRDVFPKAGGEAIEMIAGPFHAAVRQAAIVTSEESKGVNFTFEDGKVTLAAKAADIGQSSVQVPIAYDRRKLSITLDPRYLSQFLRVLDGDKAFTLTLKDADSAAVLSTEDGYRYVIMPLARDR